MTQRNPHLAFIQAVNFELTYDCDSHCGHCLQSGIREEWLGVSANPEMVKDAILQAKEAGILRSGGINLTGGEPLLAGEVVFDIIRFARSRDLLVRLSTNANWGNGRGATVGRLRFATRDDLVRHLKASGLSMFAFSFDQRFDENPEVLDRLASAVQACERAALPYDLVCTGREYDEIQDLLDVLRDRVDLPLRHFTPIRMSLVDIGRAAKCEGRSRLSAGGLARLARKSGCGTKGYHRPAIIHVDPAGGVRTCLYAPGLANLGSLEDETLIEMLGRFPDDPISRTFAGEDLADVSKELFRTEAWRPFGHGCAAAVVLARLVGAAASWERENGARPADEDLLALNRRLASAMNLARPSAS